MQTKRIATALCALTLLVGLAAAAQAADPTPRPEADAKACCDHAKADGSASGAHCERHADGAKACCAEHEKQGKNGDCCCCEKSCDRPGAKKEPAPKG